MESIGLEETLRRRPTLRFWEASIARTSFVATQTSTNGFGTSTAPPLAVGNEFVLNCSVGFRDPLESDVTASEEFRL